MPRKEDPLKIIKKDHKEVKALFKDYKKADQEEKASLAGQITGELLLHMEMEESLFYPEIEKVSEEGKNLIQDALKEHNEAKMHVDGVESAQDNSQRDMHMEELEKGVFHHIEEEEDKIFSFAKKNLEEPQSIAEKMIDFKEENTREEED